MILCMLNSKLEWYRFGIKANFATIFLGMLKISRRNCQFQNKNKRYEKIFQILYPLNNRVEKFRGPLQHLFNSKWELQTAGQYPSGFWRGKSVILAFAIVFK